MAEVRAAMTLVEDAVAGAMTRVLTPELARRDPVVRPSEHADFQSNVALSLAGPAGTPPRELALALHAELAGGPVAATLAGPGFLNLTLTDERLWGQLADRLADPRLGVGLPLAGTRTVVDYSGPNIAKGMHVGHLRSTVIGDVLARVLAFLGGEVIRQNHLGDWGTNFGMLIQYLVEHPEYDWQGDTAADQVSVLDVLYQAARRLFEADPAFAERARQRVVALQGGDEATLALWRELTAVSGKAFQALYERLGVLLTEQDTAAESSYNPYLDEVVAELVEAGIAVDSDGALCVFAEDLTGPDGEPVPLIVRKKDGGYGYPATDLATLRHRVERLGVDRILYVTDARQALHFRQVFATARRAGWLPAGVAAVHVPFGMVLGPGGTPFKTRSGGTVPLAGLLDEAVEGARAATADKAHELTAEALTEVVEAAGIGAVKYADLSTSRAKNYVFDTAQMVSLNGNTGVYLQYAHARLCTLLGKAGGAGADGVDASLPLHPAERALILRLDGFDAVLGEVARELEPHRLCGYLFALAKALTEFYGACPVLKAPTPALRANRLALCRLTARTLAQGLDLLGLKAPERM
ncbi:arginine--tRNA ligase [Kitasatospora sp. NBC_01302]|uniref:arginine--tRNA ligase n=1 Tax=Kitasatospora sp. NBC_01302 TaxID=2903575 RepID=UPI002E1121BB|nr:arginine--tRNA ligase [Kitasatospora sp. NBC_01302]